MASEIPTSLLNLLLKKIVDLYVFIKTLTLQTIRYKGIRFNNLSSVAQCCTWLLCLHKPVDSQDSSRLEYLKNIRALVICGL